MLNHKHYLQKYNTNNTANKKSKRDSHWATITQKFPSQTLFALKIPNDDMNLFDDG